MQNSKQSELSQQKKILYEKIKSLTNLLEESNRLVKSYETEVTQLKNKNSKLEYNLKMLTESHSELEKLINNDNSGLKSELQLKEQNNNELLKELEIKDLHIKSLEKLLMQSNPIEEKNKMKLDNFNKIFSQQKDKKVNKKNIKVNNNDMNNNININEKLVNSTSSFKRDDEREKELNRLMNTMQNNNSNNIYDKEMNEELRQMARETNSKEDLYNFDNINNIFLNKTLRNQLMENKNDEIKIMENIGNRSAKDKDSKLLGKILNVNKKYIYNLIIFYIF